MRTQSDCTEEITIRQLRDRSNAAIARHDVGPALAIHHDQARIIGSDGSLLDGAAAIARAFAASFADPDFVAYARCPLSIAVNGSTAAETGDWTGQWRRREVRGTYLARWSREPAGWRIVAELFIPLGQSRTP
jgi:ketosteroid isomerase-like protein